MKRLSRLILIMASATAPLGAQKIENQPIGPSQIVHLRTALNHLTVIELREPVVQVATGSPSFKVEWHENKVFVQPTEAHAATNLFIWTSSERLNYELEPAGDVSAMDFAVDQTPRAKITAAARIVPPSPPSPAEILLLGKPVRVEAAKASRRPIEVTIRDLYEAKGRMTIRYSVRNRGSRPYDITTPQVYALSGVRYPQSLYPLIGSQLGEQEASRLRSKHQNPVPVLEGHVQAEHLAPGQESVGIVDIRAISSKQPVILRFQFPNDDRQQVAAFLVR